MVEVIIGIDIGLKGAIAVINTTDPTERSRRGSMTWDTPLKRIKKFRKRGKPKTIATYDINKIKDILSGIIINNPGDTVICFVEGAQILPKGFTIKANTGLAKCQGILEGVLTSIGIRYYIINPQDWQKAIGIAGKKKSGDANVQMAKRLHPDIQFETAKGRVLDGRADALLIAEYGKSYCHSQEISNGATFEAMTTDVYNSVGSVDELMEELENEDEG